MTQADDPIRGIGLTAGATVLFAMGDTTAKFLSTRLPIVEFTWFRFVMFLGMAILLAGRAPRRAVRSRQPALQVVRAMGMIGSSLLFVFGIRQMTMAQATTISFISPLLVTILSIPLLKEVVGIRRWAAVFVGMLGVLIVVRPGTGAFQPAALFGMASSSCWAIALITTRKLASIDAPATTLLWSAGIGTAMLTLMLPFNFVWPTGEQLVLMVLLGALASAGHWMVVQAHRHAQASLLAPFNYTQLLWSTCAGYVVFNNLPDQWTLLGAGIIIVSGLYTAHRERVRARLGARRPARGGA
jgi:drug/metabolite transporter (DMT)-like permease